MNSKVINLSDYRKVVGARSYRPGRTLNLPRERCIREKARHLLIEAWRASGKPAPAQILPIEPRWIAQVLQGWSFEEPAEIGISAASGRKIAGVLNRVAKRIEVASNLPADVRRFTGAHELGHLVLHPKAQSLRESPLDGVGFRNHPVSLEEMEANVFAAELLMPTRLVREFFQRRFGTAIDRESLNDDEAFYSTNGEFGASELRKKDPVELARIIAEACSFTAADSRAFIDIFGVSPTAMAIQLVDLALVL